MIRNKLKKGNSLLEILLAIAIFTAGSIVVALLVINAGITMRYAEESSKALLYAKEGIEAMKSIRDQSFSNLVGENVGNHGVSIIDGRWSFSGSSTLEENHYTRIISISTTTATTSKVTSTVSWNFTETKVNQVQLITYLTNW
ncbi:MAG: type II secretion system protein [Minisyncoccia bacterium]